MIKINWMRDLLFEKRCDDLGVSWEYKENIRISDVDIIASLKNNARLWDGSRKRRPDEDPALNDDNVLSCVQHMRNGDPIHALSLRKIPGKTLMMLIGGNHRIAALGLLDAITFSGYIVKCTDEQYDILTRGDNNRGMENQTKDEAIEHCVHVHLTYDWQLTELAKKWGLNSQQLQKVVRNRKLRHYLEDQCIPCEKISSAVLDAMNPLKDQKAILQRAAHIISIYVPQSNIVSQMVEAVQKANTEKQKMDYLERWEKQLKDSKAPGKRKLRTPLKSKLFRILGTETGLAHLLGKCGKNGVIANINELDFEAIDAERLIFLHKELQRYLKPLLVQCQDLVRQVDQKKGRPRQN